MKRAGDHAANLERAIANTEDRASKARAHFDDKKNVETFYATRPSTSPTPNSAENCGLKNVSAGIGSPRQQTISKTPPLDQPKRD